MSKLIALALTVVIGTACGAVDSVLAAKTPAATVRPSASASAAAASAPVATTTAPVASAPATVAPTAPPPPPPTAKPTPAIKAVPPRANRGSTFVLQFSGFPTSAQGIDVVQTLTLPNGVKLTPSTFRAQPDGTGFTTYLASLGDPAGQHVIQLTGGGLSAFVILIVD